MFVEGFSIFNLILNVLYIIFFLSILWVFGRMGDNINKIRKLLENEFEKKSPDQQR
jgi:hypothetical protein